MTNQSRSKGRDAEVSRASCRIIGREAHDDTKPKEGARRVQVGVDHGQQGEGVKGTIPQEARPLILKDDLSQGPKELGSCGQSRGTRVRHSKPMRSKGPEHLKVALAKVHENSVSMKNPICARRLKREHEYARYRRGETPSRRRKTVNTWKTRPT